MDSGHLLFPSPSEFRAGLKWILGERIATNPFPCPHCGTTVDVLGTHLVTCTRSGDIGRGHYLLRDVVYEAATAAGFTTSTEVPLPGRADLIPADILISGPPLARPTAVDFSIQTTTRSSAPAGQEVRDLAAVIKKRKYVGPCQKAGWAFTPFITDTYGATSGAGRSLIRKITFKYRQLHGDEQTLLFATQIHHQISKASIARAAIALARPRFNSPEEQHPGNLTLPKPGDAPTVSVSSESQQNANASDGSFRVKVRFAGTGRGDPTAGVGVDTSGAIHRTLVWEDKELGARVWVR